VTRTPFGEVWCHPLALPRRMRRSLARTGMFSANALPDAFWQSVKLQV
jgi:hypothetical protein